VALPGASAGVFVSLQGLVVGPGDGFVLRASVTQVLDAHIAHVRQQRSGPDALAAPGAASRRTSRSLTAAVGIGVSTGAGGV